MIQITRRDWHRADIIAALKKRDVSLAGLGRENGLASTTLKNALDKPYPKGEYIIAQKLGKHPKEIWPSRYLK